MDRILPIAEKKALSKQVIDAIQKSIVDGELRPGDTLPTETELTERLGVSKSSIREAIKMLEAVGVVEIKRGQGTVLKSGAEQGFMNVIFFQLIMQEQNQDQLLGFRRMLEVGYTRMAAMGATQEDVAKIEKSVERYTAAVRGGTLHAGHDLDFHHQILEATHNKFVISLGDAVNSLFAESIEKSIAVRPEKALADHRAILAAIRAKDLAAAEKSVESSLEAWSATLNK